MICRKLPFDTYNRAITFLYGTADELNAYFRKAIGSANEIKPSNLGRWVNYTSKDGLEADFICVVKRGSANGRIVSLSHECLHCAIHTLRMAGVSLTEESEEAYAYYYQWLFVQCLLLMREKGK